MSKVYENKANLNQDFLNSICADYPENYFDWKVTVQFYVGLHKCYCVLLSRGFTITNHHNENINNLGEIDKQLSRNLFTLFKYSKQSRYEGFMNEDSMNRINKINFNDNVIKLKQIEEGVLKYYPVAV